MPAVQNTLLDGQKSPCTRFSVYEHEVTLVRPMGIYNWSLGDEMS